VKIDDLIAMWKYDGRLDKTELGSELQRIYDLHAKYLDIYSREKILLKVAQQEHAKLVKDKTEFFRIGMTKEFHAMGWVFPSPSGRILNPDIPMYQAADQQLQDSELKLELQSTVVELLHDIMDMIRYRSNTIKANIDYDIWRSGQ
jgi:Recombination, repair and ssDNA binding protein UvsY